MMRYFVFFVILMAFYTASGQTGSISGTVVDAVTGEPLPFANVFISNTTRGTTTQPDGAFLIDDVPFGAVQLVVSFVGYNHLTLSFDFTETSHLINTIQLEPSLQELTAIDVVSKKDKKWERQLGRFSRVFLGDTEFSRQCQIMNPWVIEFEEDRENGLVAKAVAPIEIENHALGYRIFYHLRLFTADAYAFFFTGETRFEEMEVSDAQQTDRWMKNRIIAYKGSTRHLFQAMLFEYIQAGQLAAEGFTLFQEKFPREGAIVRHPDLARTKKEILVPYALEELVGPSYRTGLYRIALHGKIEVHYNRQLGAPKNTIYNDTLSEVSWLQVHEGFIDVTKTGINQRPEQLLVSGAMSQGWIAMMLPGDYAPQGNENP